MKLLSLFFLAGFLCLTGMAQSQQTAGVVRISVPGTAGALELPATADFQQRVRPDGKETQARDSNRSTGLFMTAFLQHVDFTPSATECRKQWWDTTKEPPQMHRENIKLTESGDIARVDYDVPVAQGIKVDQHSVHAYMGGGSECAEIHLSVVQYAPSKDAIFNSFLKSVKFIADAPAASPAPAPSAGPPPAGSAQEQFAKASRFYLERNYKMAALYYQRALEMEKQTPTLSDPYFKVLVDNLGMSYGIDGDLVKAKSTFEYGISKRPNYPMFYYNLACTFGEMGQMQPAIVQLREAYKYKANMIPGETLPDPMTDDSFRNFINNKAFGDAVSNMKAR